MEHFCKANSLSESFKNQAKSLAKATLYALIKMCAAWYEKTAILAIVGANDVLVCAHASGINPVDVKGRVGWEFLHPCPILALFRTIMVRA
jgi:hypothetical protein